MNLAKAKGINVACVVRRESAVAGLKELGADVVLVDSPDLARVGIHSATPPTPPLMVALKRALATMGQGDTPISTREQVETDWRAGWRPFFMPGKFAYRSDIHGLIASSAMFSTIAKTSRSVRLVSEY